MPGAPGSPERRVAVSAARRLPGGDGRPQAFPGDQAAENCAGVALENGRRSWAAIEVLNSGCPLKWGRAGVPVRAAGGREMDDLPHTRPHVGPWVRASWVQGVRPGVRSFKLRLALRSLPSPTPAFFGRFS